MMTPREAELTRQPEAAVSALEATRRENELLRRKIDLLVRRVFGSSSEQLPANQLELLFAQAEPQAPQPERAIPPASSPRSAAVLPQIQNVPLGNLTFRIALTLDNRPGAMLFAVVALFAALQEHKNQFTSGHRTRTEGRSPLHALFAISAAHLPTSPATYKNQSVGKFKISLPEAEVGLSSLFAHPTACGWPDIPAFSCTSFSRAPVG